MSGRWDDHTLPKSSATQGRDPYLRWAMHTKWRGFSQQAGWSSANDPNGEVRIIGRVKDFADLAQLQKGVGGHLLQVPELYLSPLPNKNSKKYTARHFTATIQRHAVEEWLIDNPLGLIWRLALSMRDPLQAGRTTSKGLYGPDRDAVEMRATNLVEAAVPTLDSLGHPRSIDGAIVLIDHGCPFLHTKFREKPVAGSNTRVTAIWDQGAAPRPGQPKGWPWRKPRNLPYGRELGPAALEAISYAASNNAGLEETAVYRSIDFMMDVDDARRRVWYGTHGGHLMDMIAGRPDPLSKQEEDSASDAKLVFVQLPMAAALDSAGASLSAHLLDGVRYALSVCKPESPLVINISYGGHTGPHDGSSLLESALDEVLANCSGNVAIVLAAGNARESRCHARRQLRPNRSALLRIALSAFDSTDTFAELWYEKPPAGQKVQLRVLPPNRQWSRWIGPGDEAVLRADSASRDVLALLRHDETVPNGKRCMVLLAVAPTEQPKDVSCDLAEAGEWQIEARLVGADGTASSLPADAHLTIDAWIEREDPNRGSSGHRPYFIDQEPGDERGTLSSIATGELTLVVGGFNMATGRPAPYSSLGENDGPKPALLAACEDDEAEPTIAAAATRSSEVLRLNGTSVATPVFARRLYHVMKQHGPFTATELREVATFLALSGVDPHIKPYAED